jgi:hypothetical protein
MLFGVELLTLVGIIALTVLFETVLFWAAASLADAPEAGILKCGLISVLALALWWPATILVFYFFGMLFAPLLGVFRNYEGVRTTVALGLVVVTAWALPVLLALPIVPVSLKKGVMISTFQFLMRLLLWALVIAVALVVLAVVQITRNPTDQTGQAPAPRVVLARAT